MDEDDIENEEKEHFDEEGSDYYNPNFTLRKCCSKIIDRLSHLIPKKTFEILLPHLEVGIQSNDWLIKYFIYYF